MTVDRVGRVALLAITPAHGRGRRRHLRRHRGPHQLPAVGARTCRPWRSSRRRRARRLAREPALQGRRRRRRDRQGQSAAAAIATPPAARPRARSKRCGARPLRARGRCGHGAGAGGRHLATASWSSTSPADPLPTTWCRWPGATFGARVGHTGTLDPMATGVLPLVVGRATRLAQFMTGVDKVYEATIAFGRETDTYDAAGQTTRETGQAPATPRRSRRRWRACQAAGSRRRRSTRPRRSAAKRAHRLARAEHARRAGAGGGGGARGGAGRHRRRFTARVRLRVSAGFYVRSLAHDLGTDLGVGAAPRRPASHSAAGRSGSTRRRRGRPSSPAEPPCARRSCRRSACSSTCRWHAVRQRRRPGAPGPAGDGAGRCRRSRQDRSVSSMRRDTWWASAPRRPAPAERPRRPFCSRS